MRQRNENEEMTQLRNEKQFTFYSIVNIKGMAAGQEL